MKKGALTKRSLIGEVTGNFMCKHMLTDSINILAKSFPPEHFTFSFFICTFYIVFITYYEFILFIIYYSLLMWVGEDR